MAKELSIKELKFCSEYAIDENGSRSAIAAGYAPKSAAVTASRLLKKANIRAEIDRLTAKTLEKLEITRDYVLDGIKSTIERCRQIEQVFDKRGNEVLVETPDGEEAKAFTFQAMGALKGYELLGKHLKMFTDKVEHGGENGGPLQVIVKRIGFDGKS